MSFFIIPAFWFVGERDNRHAQFSGYVLLDELFKLVEPLVNLLLLHTQMKRAEQVPVISPMSFMTQAKELIYPSPYLLLTLTSRLSLDFFFNTSL